MSKVSCQQCHSGPVWKSWVNATLPPPLPVDQTHPGRERQRSCDYQNQPACRPCEGLGGARWGDGAEEFTPVNCTVVATADQVPASERPEARFPAVGQAFISGDTRQPLAVRPDPAKPGKYPAVSAVIKLGWDSSMARYGYDIYIYSLQHSIFIYVQMYITCMARHRYDFQHMPPFSQPASQLYLQTAAQMAAQNTSGVMVSIIGSQQHLSVCVCTDAVAGVMHIDSFVPNATDDPVPLPADQGGLAYLGRIRLSPIDGGNNSTVLADHYMKWAFHFLVDADPQSPGYGKPLRLYGATGVRFIYSNWTLEDPRAADPDVFEIPKHCLLLSKTCREMHNDGEMANAA